MQDDSGGEEDDENKVRADDEVVEVDKECHVAFREESRQALGDKKVLLLHPEKEEISMKTRTQCFLSGSFIEK